MKALIIALSIHIVLMIWIGYAWCHSAHPQLQGLPQSAQISSLTTSVISTQPLDIKKITIDTMVSNAFQNQVIIQKTFVAPGNLDGLVLALKDSPSEQFIAYVDPNQKLLYLGQVIDATGKNTTLHATQIYLSDPQKPLILAAFKKVAAIVTGSKKAKHTMTIITDPNSPLFRTLYQNFFSDQDQYDLQIRWILVDYLKPMGPNLAGWILSAKDPAKRLVEVANKPLDHWTFLKVPALEEPVIDALREHWNLMQNYHLVPGPVSIFQTKDHDYVIQGLVDPESFEQLLPEILM